MNSIHQFKVESIEGKEIDFADFKGKIILVVNVASECGFTPQYQQLEELYQEFKDILVIVGFPCNDFGNQEPSANIDIQQFCTTRYGVSFPMAAKVSIKGKNITPIYKWLTNKNLNGVLDSEVDWNFQKYILDKEGQLLAKLSPATSPISEEILDYLIPS